MIRDFIFLNAKRGVIYLFSFLGSGPQSSKSLFNEYLYAFFFFFILKLNLAKAISLFKP